MMGYSISHCGLLHQFPLQNQMLLLQLACWPMLPADPCSLLTHAACWPMQPAGLLLLPACWPSPPPPHLERVRIPIRGRAIERHLVPVLLMWPDGLDQAWAGVGPVVGL